MVGLARFEDVSVVYLFDKAGVCFGCKKVLRNSMVVFVLSLCFIKVCDDGDLSACECGV